ncbi:MAG: hypothetical protein IT381_20320 [Deltaproteobacteria bacterium]|nr:hypothetical protein [Deltaproteobacteria bacterium]
MTLLVWLFVAAASEPVSLPASETASMPASPTAVTPAAPTKPPLVSASFGHGIVFSLGKEIFELKLRARIQVRFSHVEPGRGSTATKIDEFMIRRARIFMEGVFLKDFKLRMQLGLAPRDMESDAPNPLRDAQISYTRLRDLSIRLGQGKVQFDRHRMTSSARIIFPERADVMTELTLDRDIGAEIYSDDLFGAGGRFAYAFGVWGGDGRNRFAPNAGLLYSLRLQISPFGSFDDAEGDHTRERRLRMAIGLAGARNNATIRTLSTTGAFYRLPGGFSHWHATADVVVKVAGFYFLGAWFLRVADEGARSGNLHGVRVTEYSRSATGMLAQAAMMTCEYFELIARYGYLHPLGSGDPALKVMHQFAGGMNFYTGASHNLKLTVDYDFAGDERLVGRHTVRLQAQMYF